MEAGRTLTRTALVSGTSGNLSCRTERGVWITPSGLPYDELTALDLVLTDIEGHPIEGLRDASVELPMHLAAYRARDDIRAVVHTHPVHVTALAMLGWELPPVLDSLAGVLGGPVPVLDYAPSGSMELAAQVGAAMGVHPALILKNHGLVVGHATLRGALDMTHLIERSAHAYLLARQAGTPEVLPSEVVAERRSFVLGRYGQRETPDAAAHPLHVALRQAALESGVAIRIKRFPEGTRTARDAARAVGTGEEAIVKSLVFMAQGRPVLALVAGDRRADERALEAVFGGPVRRATPDEARQASGAAIGGVAPFAHPAKLETAMDAHLLSIPTVWCAAGTPETVFAIDPEDLRRITEAVMLGDEGA